jgi:hypothetical protein
VQGFSKADELAKLAELKHRGLLSEKEYRGERRALLGPNTPKVRASLAIGVVVVFAIAGVIGFRLGQTPSHSNASNSKLPLNATLTSTAAETSAVSWAQAQIGSRKWYGLCLTFVQDAYQYGAGINLPNETSGVVYNSNTDPEDVWGHFSGGIWQATTNESGIPYGALVFFNAKPGYDPEDYSHVTIMGAGDEMISTPDVANESVVHEETFAQVARAYATYVGWWLPDGTSTPPAPAPTSPPATAPPATSPPSTSPVATSPPSGGGSQSSASSGSGGATSATSGAAPANPKTPTGSSGSSPSTASTPASNGSGGSQPPPTTTPTTVPAPTTYSETVGSVAHTWTNYTNAGGTEGPSIANGQTVAITCKLTGFAVADGNTWWYQIAQSPWDNNYYVSADAFYNNGQTSGSLVGTPFVDPNVPNC